MAHYSGNRRARPVGLCIATSVLVLACGNSEAVNSPDVGADTALVALSDLRAGTYLGFQGGLYPGGSNDLPVSHTTRGAQERSRIQPLNNAGTPATTGRIVLLSIGMSNTTQEFCAQGGIVCDAWTFAGQAAMDPTVNHTTLVIANGAAGGQVAENWDAPTDANYQRVRDQVLAPLGVSEAQVQIVWLKVARSNPRNSLPAENADAFVLEQLMGSIARTLKSRYPNVRQIFASSRIYAGYATTSLNPEPYAYESGFAVKWLIEAQIRQENGGSVDARAGDLSPAAAPWLAWGPYLWAREAAHARSDGLFWLPSEFQSDGTHPAQEGERKVGRMLLDFFKTSPFTTCWFLAGRVCS